jgi:hypothetical protein
MAHNIHPVTERDDKTPVDQIADLLLYAPIGLFFEAPSLLPKLAEQGRVHARNARLFGQLAVRHGEAEVRRRLGDVEEQTTGLLRAFGVLPEDHRDGADAERAETAAGDAASTPRTTASGPASGTRGPVAAPAAPGPGVGELAITDYDSLSASHVVTRLPGLTLDELEAVRAYEAAHRGRKTILNKVAQLQQ